MAEKDVIRTDKAPGPFQGAPYNQAIRVGDLVFVAGQLGISLETGALAGAGVAEQTEQIMANLGAILDAAGSGLTRVRAAPKPPLGRNDRTGRNARNDRNGPSDPEARRRSRSRWRPVDPRAGCVRARSEAGVAAVSASRRSRRRGSPTS